MRSKLLVGGLGAAVAFLLATNPIVAQAAGFITSGDIKNSTIKSKDVKNNNLKGKDIKESTLETVPSAANAGSLAGAPASSYLDNATVHTFSKTSATSAVTLRIPVPPGGTYYIAYSALMVDASGNSGCFMYRETPGGSDTVYFGEERDTTGGASPGYSGSGVTSPAVGQVVELICDSDSDWTTYPNEPIQVVVIPLDTVTPGTLTASTGGASAAQR